MIATNQWTQSDLGPCDQAHRIYCFSTVITIFADGFESGDPGAWSASSP
jgi:hypothetical protein